MVVYIGSARRNEYGEYEGGVAGDQLQKETIDYTGEVSMQKMYAHKKGWWVLRPKSAEHANNIAKCMYNACNNRNIGYSQGNRYGIVAAGTKAETPCNCDCSSLVRVCVKEGTGIDPKDFTTSNEKDKLLATGLFEKPFAYTSQMILYDGDVLVTRSKGHTAIVVSGSPRSIISSSVAFYPAYNGTSNSIVDALAFVGEADTSLNHRKIIAQKNDIDITNNIQMNKSLLEKLKAGILKKG